MVIVVFELIEGLTPLQEAFFNLQNLDEQWGRRRWRHLIHQELNSNVRQQQPFHEMRIQEWHTIHHFSKMNKVFYLSFENLRLLMCFEVIPAKHRNFIAEKKCFHPK